MVEFNLSKTRKVLIGMIWSTGMNNYRLLQVLALCIATLFSSLVFDFRPIEIGFLLLINSLVTLLISSLDLIKKLEDADKWEEWLILGIKHSKLTCHIALLGNKVWKRK
ncbi:hypothetical protein A1QO_04240 [Vibrio genomosp. F10 str. ZF-129]|uniref:Uncharacterized protein n=1 Tax=Vibrio genomosp. F10 str. ZF-129 TaxID=1187848 RepID=A0A1E5BJ34_9VIBR|nr:hypothetical protein [Vibrio genomosp. F10]OEE37322.1 hypothetical protein A1QO_04240 [Vibrio genomosp. F10 str. ZF-129]